MNLIPLNVILKLLRDPTNGAKGDYASGYRDALLQVRSEVEQHLETYIKPEKSKKKNIFEPL